MGNVYIVFDFKTPAGFLPFCYTSSTISKNIEYTILNNVSYEHIFEGNQKILTYNLDERCCNDNNLYIILIDSKLQNVNISNIVSPKLKGLLDNSDNFIIHYFDYGIEEMRSLI